MKKLLLILLILLLLPLNTIADPKGWDKSVKISSDKAHYPSLFCNENTLGITWLEEGTEGHSIVVRISKDNGNTWNPEIKILSNITSKIDPVSSIINNDGKIFIVWGELDNQVYITSSSDSGKTWAQKLKLTDTKFTSCLPKIYKGPENEIYVFYHEDTGKVFNVLLISSRDGGKTWNKPQKLINQLDKKTRGSFFPSITIMNDIIHTVWQNRLGGEGNEKIDDELFTSSSSDKGKSWLLPHRLTSNVFDDDRPCIIATRDGQAFMVWEHNKEGNWQISLLKGIIIDDEIDWEPEDVAEKVSLTASDSRYAVSIIRDNKLYIFWYDHRTGNYNLFSRYYDIKNKKLSKEQQITFTKYNSKKPVISQNSHSIYLVWQDELEKVSSIYFKKQDKKVTKPRIVSSTHKDMWVSNPNPEFKSPILQDDSGIIGYAYMLDKNPNTQPDIINFNGNNLIIKYENRDDGEWYFHLRAIDGVNNWSETSHYKISIDTTGPEILNIESPTHITGIPTFDVNPKLKWTAIDKNVISGYSYLISNNKNKIPQKKIITKDNNVKINYPKRGNFYFIVMGIDKIGNWGSPSYYSISIDIDTIPPQKPLISSASHAEFAKTRNSDPEFNWSASDSSGIKGYSYLLTKDKNKNPLNKISDTEISKSFTKLQNGIYYFKVKACDKFNNWSKTAVYTIIIFIDKTPPSPPIITSPTHPKNKTIVHNSPEFFWKTTDESDILGYSYILSDDPSTIPEREIKTELPNKQFNKLENGTYYFNVIACDTEKNWSKLTSYKISIFIDRIPPEKPLITIADLEDNILHKENVTIKWTAKDNAGIKGYSIIFSTNKNDPIENIININKNSKSFIKLTQSKWYFKVKAVDPQNNWSETGNTNFIVKIDREGPIINLISSDTHKENKTSDNNNPKLFWEASDESGIKGYSYILSDNPDAIPKKEIKSKLPNKQFKNLQNGTYYFKLIACDARMNWSNPASYKISVYIDTFPPEKPLITIAGLKKNILDKDYTTIKWSSKDDTGIKGYSILFTKTKNAFPNNNIDTSEVSKNYTKLEQGKWYFKIKSIDHNNNWSKIGRTNFIIKIDREGPVINFISSDTHKNNLVSDNNNPELTWKASDDSSIKGYSYILTESETEQPEQKINYNKTKISFPDLANGNYIFKLIACDIKGNWGKIKSFNLNIYIDKFEPSKPVFVKMPAKKSTNRNVTFSYESKDDIGVSGYFTLLSESIPDVIENKLNTETASISYSNLIPGKYCITVAAVDKKLNWSEPSFYEFKIIENKLLVIAQKEAAAQREREEIEKKKRAAEALKEQQAIAKREKEAGAKRAKEAAKKEAEAAAHREKEAIVQEKRETAALKEKEAIAQKEIEAAAERKRETEALKKKEAIARKEREAAALKEKEVIAQKEIEAAAERERKAEALKKKEAIARKEREAAALKEKEAIAQKAREASALKERKAIAKMERELATLKEKQSIAQKYKEAAAKRESEAAAEKEREAITRREKEVTAQKGKEVIARKEIEAAAEREREAVAKKGKETISKKGREAAAKEEKEAIAKMERETAAKKERKAIEKMEKEVAALKEKQAIEQKKKEAITKKEKKAAAKNEREAATLKEKEAIAQMEREIAALKEKQAIEQKKKEAAVHKAKEAAAKKEREIAALKEKQAIAQKEKEAVAEREKQAIAKKEKEVITRKPEEPFIIKGKQSITQQERDAAAKNDLLEAIAQLEIEIAILKEKHAIAQKAREAAAQKERDAIAQLERILADLKTRYTIFIKEKSFIAKKEKEPVPEKIIKPIVEKEKEVLTEKQPEPAIAKKDKIITSKTPEPVIKKEKQVAVKKKISKKPIKPVKPRTIEMYATKNEIIYPIKRGDVLSKILHKVLLLKNINSYKLYINSVALYNNIENIDLIVNHKAIHFPSITIYREQNLKTFMSRSRINDPNRLVIYRKVEAKRLKAYPAQQITKLLPGDKIVILKSKFLSAGKSIHYIYKYQ